MGGVCRCVPVLKAVVCKALEADFIKEAQPEHNIFVWHVYWLCCSTFSSLALQVMRNGPIQLHFHVMRGAEGKSVIYGGWLLIFII